jgi:uncharacterized membrane-anchored protein
MVQGFGRLGAIVAAAFLVCAAPAFADGPDTATPDVAAPPVRAAPVAAPAAAPAAAPFSRTGAIPLSNDAFTLTVPAGYRFYSAEEARAFLSRNNAAAPRGEVLGLLARANARLDAPDLWATVVTYDAIGYVPAEGASGLASPSLESDVRAARTEQNRPFEGFALAPGYEPSTNSLAWAERVASPGAGGRDLRHEVRLLGRYGVVGFTSLGSADQMGEMTGAAPNLLSMVSFPTGAAYGDFQAASDTVSNFEVPGLVTGVPKPELAAAASDGATQSAPSGGLPPLFLWIAGGVVLAAGAGYLFMRRRGSGDANLGPDEE